MHSFMAIVPTFLAVKQMLSYCRLRHLRGLIQGVRIAEKYEKTLLVNCLVGKVDSRLTDNASNMRKAFDVTASFHDEETSLAITCITACIAI